MVVLVRGAHGQGVKPPTRRLAAALGLPLLATGVPITAPVAAAPRHVVTVEGTDGVGAEFSSAKGRKVRSGFKAVTPRDDTGYRLAVTIDDFHGFRIYDMAPGANSDPWISVAGGGARYSNLFQPPFPSPGFGRLQFSNHTLLGVAYTPTWNPTGTDAVILTGVLTCRWPKR
jgi:hypothetical protein